jgi:diketogulonate reductase-like aldo/keto reductase
METSNKINIPPIGLGTYELENPEESTYSAIKLGYRMIDTATLYYNEEQIGKAIKRCIDEGIVKRSDLFITSKIWNDEKDDPEAAIKRSLERLGLDYLDLYLIHWPIGKVENGKLVKQVPLHETWAEMEKCVEKGLTRHIGVSNFNIQILLDLLSYAKIKPAINQVEMHPLFQDNDLVEFCKTFDITVEAYNPINKGISPRKLADYEKYDLFKNETILKLAEKYGRTPAQIILNWHYLRGVVTVPKSSNPERQLENLKSTEFKLSEEDYETICKMDLNMRFHNTKIKFFCAGINLYA